MAQMWQPMFGRRCRIRNVCNVLEVGRLNNTRSGKHRQGNMKDRLTMRLRKRAIPVSTDTISVGARFDAGSTRRFARAISRMADRHPAHAIIDMSKTSDVDSSGFGSLVSGLKKLGAAGITPVVVCTNVHVRRLMDFAGVARMFTVVDRMSDARRVLAAATAEALAS